MEIISWLYTNFVYRDKMVISRQYEEPQMCCIWYIHLERKERKTGEISVLSVSGDQNLWNITHRNIISL